MMQQELTTEMGRIVLVSDAPKMLENGFSILQQQVYQFSICAGVESQLEAELSRQLPAMILLDAGLGLIRLQPMMQQVRAYSNELHIPIVLLSLAPDDPDIAAYLDAGADDFFVISMPPVLLLARFRTLLDAAQMKTLVQQQRKAISHEMSRRIREVRESRQMAVRALAKLAEIRDPETGYHILRAQAYVRLLATDLRGQPRFAAMMTAKYIGELEQAALLHDIGKVGIPDRILQKPDMLTPEEREIMKMHTVIGARAIEQVEQRAGETEGFLTAAREMAHWHHECWDGSGYPDGLAGEQIPLSARLMAVADVFDAIISRRIYKAEQRCEEAHHLIVTGSGHQFDPDIVAAFERQYPAFCEAAERYADLGIPTLPELPEPFSAPERPGI